jgi:hypothetical protein
MKSGTALAATLLALASFSLLAQQPAPANQPNTPATQQSAPGATQTPPAAAPQSSSAPATETAAPPAAAAVEMRPVNAELETKLDSKTAKAGDNIVVKTKTAIKTADGTVIPKGSKLVGHITGVQPSGAGANSQVALQFDHIELKGGQSMPVQSQIQSIAPPEGSASTGGGDVSGRPMSAPQAAGAAGTSSPGMSGASGANKASAAPAQSTGSEPGAAAPAASGGPAAGTVVAKNGNIAIQTTSIPGVLLANNAPGEQDPRMAKTSSILLGAKKDIQLDGGTQMVVGLSASASGGAQ